jgi:hypothetical protein
MTKNDQNDWRLRMSALNQFRRSRRVNVLNAMRERFSSAQVKNMKHTLNRYLGVSESWKIEVETIPTCLLLLTDR